MGGGRKRGVVQRASRSLPGGPDPSLPLPSASSAGAPIDPSSFSGARLSEIGRRGPQWLRPPLQRAKVSASWPAGQPAGEEAMDPALLSPAEAPVRGGG